MFFFLIVVSLLADRNIEWTLKARKTTTTSTLLYLFELNMPLKVQSPLNQQKKNI